MSWAAMLILFVVILLVVGLAIIGALYSLFVPFLGQLADIKQYNMAYYGAVSSVERGMLSLRYHGPGFEGQSGWSGSVALGNVHDGGSSDFHGLHAEGSLFWSIRSRSTTIPSVGQGNTSFAFRSLTSDSADYNALSRHDLAEYSVFLDQTTDASLYYSPYQDFSASNGLNSVSLHVRLPSALFDFYGVGLCDSGIGCDADNDRISDDVIVDWSWLGSYRDDSFRIMPRSSLNYVSGFVYAADSHIRESDINRSHDTLSVNDVTARRGGNIYSYNPVASVDVGVVDVHNIIGSNAIYGANLPGYSALYNNYGLDHLRLVLSLSSHVRGSAGIYPYLETKIVADEPIADAFYHLDGQGRVGDYDVTIKVKKPTNGSSLLGSFTVVF